MLERAEKFRCRPYQETSASGEIRWTNRHFDERGNRVIDYTTSPFVLSIRTLYEYIMQLRSLSMREMSQQEDVSMDRDEILSNINFEQNNLIDVTDRMERDLDSGASCACNEVDAINHHYCAKCIRQFKMMRGEPSVTIMLRMNVDMEKLHVDAASATIAESELTLPGSDWDDLTRANGLDDHG